MVKVTEAAKVSMSKLYNKNLESQKKNKKRAYF